MKDKRRHALDLATRVATYESGPEQIVEFAEKFLQFLNGGETTVTVDPAVPELFVYYTDENMFDGEWPTDTYVRKFPFGSNDTDTGWVKYGKSSEWAKDGFTTRGQLDREKVYAITAYADLPGWAR